MGSGRSVKRLSRIRSWRQAPTSSAWSSPGRAPRRRRQNASQIDSVWNINCSSVTGSRTIGFQALVWSRAWPLSIVERRKLRGVDGSGVGEVLAATIEGERGRIQLFVVMLDYPLDASRVRQEQVRQLVQLISETTRQRYPVLVCGDFNAGPDSDEIRMLTGRSAPAAPGCVFYDVWEVAGNGSAGETWSNRNPLAAVAMYPDRRFDYVLSAWPRLGAVGHPTHCELLGVVPSDQMQLSDHYGVLADIRY